MHYRCRIGYVVKNRSFLIELLLRILQCIGLSVYPDTTEHVRPHLISVMSYHGLRICNDNVKFFFLFPVVLLHILLSVLDEFLSGYYFRIFFRMTPLAQAYFLIFILYFRYDFEISYEYAAQSLILL